MRVADKMNYNNALHNMNKNRTELLSFQNQAATQKSINKPSDNPLAAARILESRTEMVGFDQFKRNILSAKEFIEFSEQSLGQLGDILVRAKELAIDQADDAANGPETRRIAASEIRQLYEQTVNIANKRFGDRYLFGGYRSTQTPFDMTGTYFGDDGEVEVEIDKGSYVKMNMPGSVIFLGRKLNQIIPPDKVMEDGNTTVEVRGPASVESSMAAQNQTLVSKEQGVWGHRSTNIFETLRDLEVALNANDKRMVQFSLDSLDNAFNQINMARGELGSRISSLNTGLETLQKMNVDAKAYQSEMEDVDMYELVNNLSRTQNQLQASLTTSGKMMQTSLLDFLR
ncbi:MAG: flagellar hook-associated protein FlgL [Bdellovibrionaceae bacterium]|nr:flagellar hook-associated protein FlgL [Pseudobdellovibrionaceae bacterium]